MGRLIGAVGTGGARSAGRSGACETLQSMLGVPSRRGLVSRLGEPFELVHLNEQSEALEAFTTGGTPCVVGESGGTLHLLLGPEGLETCEGQVSAFEEALVAAIESSSPC